jgi:acyl carrier protein
MRNAPAVVDAKRVQFRLRQLLFALIEKNGANSFGSADAILDNIQLSATGITSIDFLEFALAVEEEFKIEILETMDPDKLPLTLHGWGQEVCTRLASRQG